VAGAQHHNSIEFEEDVGGRLMDGSDDGPSCRRQLFQRENERVGRGTVQAACRFIQKEYRRFCYKLNPDWLKKK